MPIFDNWGIFLLTGMSGRRPTGIVAERLVRMTLRLVPAAVTAPCHIHPAACLATSAAGRLSHVQMPPVLPLARRTRLRTAARSASQSRMCAPDRQHNNGPISPQPTFAAPSRFRTTIRNTTDQPPVVTARNTPFDWLGNTVFSLPQKGEKKRISKSNH